MLNDVIATHRDESVSRKERAVRLGGELVRFGCVGVASTLAFFALYLVLREPLGAQGANLISLLVTAVANTAANRRWTFGVRGPDNAMKHYVGGLGAFAVALALTSGSLWGLRTWFPDCGRVVEVLVLVVSNGAAPLLRFASLRLLMGCQGVA